MAETDEHPVDRAEHGERHGECDRARERPADGLADDRGQPADNGTPSTPITAPGTLTSAS
ncbi:hypothetical protein FHX44_112916 [Pseudonocardia hierapolitana]|uniref:Uncharacterized protein n=1 Tax=Pseudonocardia hierapolitana TaxID=1128676 RepID=A0A561SQ76_9PSEU|nr:hypothetical protein [Pseudonocardia hierapolitana]TWF77017.1 hypothetical protein FHX44_112916 [Pseudonocardia hierapolitana]